MTYRILSPAETDLVQAMEYYEQASTGLGVEFLAEVERTIQRILMNPDAWSKVARGVFRTACSTGSTNKKSSLLEYWTFADTRSRGGVEHRVRSSQRPTALTSCLPRIS